MLKNNTIEEATEKIIELQEKGFTNFICGTHTIYRAFCDVAKDIIEDIKNGDNSKKTKTYYPKIM